MARAALASGSKDGMRQCLRMIEHGGLLELLGVGASKRGKGKDAAEQSRKEGKRVAFYQSKLAEACFSIVQAIYDGKPSTQDDDDLAHWVSVQPELAKIAAGNRSWRPLEEMYEDEDVDPVKIADIKKKKGVRTRVMEWERGARHAR